MKRRGISLLSVAVLAAAAVAMGAGPAAATHAEGPTDAGDMPSTAQVVAAGETEITGAITDTSVDMFRITVATPSTWSAMTVGTTGDLAQEPQLLLFDGQGHLLASGEWNGPENGSGFEAYIPPGTITTAGTYYLAITDVQGWPTYDTGSGLVSMTYPSDLTHTLAGWFESYGWTGTYSIHLGWTMPTVADASAVIGKGHVTVTFTGAGNPAPTSFVCQIGKRRNAWQTCTSGSTFPAQGAKYVWIRATSAAGVGDEVAILTTR